MSGKGRRGERRASPCSHERPMPRRGWHSATAKGRAESRIHELARWLCRGDACTRRQPGADEPRMALGDSQGQKESNRPDATTERLPMAGATRQPARYKLLAYVIKMRGASRRRKDSLYKRRLTAAVYEVFILCGSKISGADAGRWSEGGPAFWVTGELRRCVVLSPAKSCQTWLCGAKVRRFRVMRK